MFVVMMVKVLLVMMMMMMSSLQWYELTLPLSNPNCAGHYEPVICIMDMVQPGCSNLGGVGGSHVRLDVQR